MQTARGWQDLKFLARLAPGSRVEVLQGRLVLSFLQGGARTELLAPARVTLLASGVRPDAGSASRVQAGRPVPKGVSVLPAEVDFNRMAGKVRGIVTLVGDPGARPGQARLRWTTPGPYAEFEVEVLRAGPEGAGERVLRQVVPGTDRELALPALPAGCYEARVTGSAVPGGAGVESAPFGLTVLGPEACEGLARMEAAWEAERGGPGRDVSLLTLLLWDYLSLGLDADARRAAAELETLRPGNDLSAAVTRLLGP